MKVISGIVCLVLVLAWAGSMGDDSDAETQSATVEAVSNESSEADKIDTLTREGQLLSNAIAGLAQEGADAAKASDIDRACSVMDEVNAKMDRLAVVTDDLTYMESIDPSLIADMRLNYAEMKAGIATANEMC